MDYDNYYEEYKSEIHDVGTIYNERYSRWMTTGENILFKRYIKEIFIDNTNCRLVLYFNSYNDEADRVVYDYSFVFFKEVLNIIKLKKYNNIYVLITNDSSFNCKNIFFINNLSEDYINKILMNISL